MNPNIVIHYSIIFQWFIGKFCPKFPVAKRCITRITHDVSDPKKHVLSHKKKGTSVDAKLEEHIYISIAIQITHTLNAYFPIKKGTRVDPKLEPYVHTILYIF